MSSATLVWAGGGGSTASARRSSGGAVGMSAGGVGRRGSSAGAAAAWGGFREDPGVESNLSLPGVETIIGGGSGRTTGVAGGGFDTSRGGSGGCGASIVWVGPAFVPGGGAGGAG